MDQTPDAVGINQPVPLVHKDVWDHERGQMKEPIEAEPLTGKPVDASPAGNVMSIRDCPACGGIHSGLKITECNKPSVAGTHWYLCPTLGDPCFVTLAAAKAGEGLELDGKVCQMLARSQMAGQWIVAGAWMLPDGRFAYWRHSFKFPHFHFPELIKKFRENLEAEIGPLQPEKMAEAGPLPPLANVFGHGITPLD